jgi:hypothetical protein
VTVVVKIDDDDGGEMMVVSWHSGVMGVVVIDWF